MKGSLTRDFRPYVFSSKLPPLACEKQCFERNFEFDEIFVSKVQRFSFKGTVPQKSV
jgi:hypothetical protein